MAKPSSWLLIITVAVLFSACQSSNLSQTPLLAVTVTLSPVASLTSTVVPSRTRRLESITELVATRTPRPTQTVVKFTYPTNIPQTPVPISWQEAETLILNGEVWRVDQFHSLQVTLYLVDGRMAITTEPRIDEVIHIIERCGDPCYGISIGTE